MRNSVLPPWPRGRLGDHPTMELTMATNDPTARRTTRLRKALALLTAGATALALMTLSSPAAFADDPPIYGFTGVMIAETPTGTAEVFENEGVVTAWRIVDPGADVWTAEVAAVAYTDSNGLWNLPLHDGQYVLEMEYLGDAADTHPTFYPSSTSSLAAELAEKWAYSMNGSNLGFGTKLVRMGGDIRVTVETPSSTPLVDQPVTLYEKNPGTGDWDARVTGTRTGPDGTAAFLELPRGDYQVVVGGSSGYVVKHWPNQLGLPDGDSEKIFLNWASSQDVSLTLSKTGKISGTVTSTTGKKLKGIEVTAYLFDSNSWDYNYYATTTTGSKGTYTLTGIEAGEYAVGFASAPGATESYASEYWNDAEFIDWSDTVEVKSGKTTSKINASLTRVGSISGTVTGVNGLIDRSDLGFAVCETYVWGPDCDYPDVEFDDATGAYTMDQILPGLYTLFIEYYGSDNYVGEYYGNTYNWRAAQMFTVSAGTVSSGRDIVLDEGATVTGTITSTPSGLPISGATVYLYEFSGEGAVNDWEFTSVTTNPAGEYSIDGVPSGLFTIRVEAPDHSPTWRPGVYSRDASTLFSTTAGQTTSGVDLAAAASVTVIGTVTTLDYSPLENVEVTAIRWWSPGSSKFDVVDYAYTSSDGTYSLEGLPPGEYSLHFSHYNSSEAMLDQFWGSPLGTLLEDADRFTAEAGETAIRDMQASRASAYTGRLVNSANEPLPDVYLYIDDEWSVYTDEFGEFYFDRMWLGDHQLSTDTSELDEQGVNYADRIIDLPTVTAANTVIDVGDIVLEKSGSAAGVVRDKNGKALRDIEIIAYTVEHNGTSIDEVAWAYSNSQGYFEFDDLPITEIYLSFRNWDDEGYDMQYLGGAHDWTVSDSLDFSYEGQHHYVDARIYKGAAISGVVKNAATGKPVKGMYVDASMIGTLADELNGDLDSSRSTVTNSKGAYTLPGLAPGSYWVSVDTWFDTRFTGAGTTRYVPESGTVKSNFSLSPTVRVSGTVTDVNGDPVRLAEVTAHPVVDGVVLDNTGTSNTNGVPTDAAGNYTLYLNRGTKYVIQASHPDYSTTFLGGTDFPTAPGTTVLTMGSKSITKQNLTLQPAATGSITATVVDSNGEQIDGVYALTRVDGDVELTVTNGGYFDPLDRAFPITGLVPGDYVLWLFTSDSRSFPVTVGTGETDMGELGAADSEGFTQLLTVTPGGVPEIIVDGALQVGASLHVTEGSWYGTPNYFVYQWQRDGRAIPGAQSDTYVLGLEDVGKKMTVLVGATNGWWMPEDELYVQTGPTGVVPALDEPIPTLSPSISGAARVGSKLTASAGLWDTPNLAFSYEWVRTSASGPDVVLSTKSSYTLKTQDVWTDGPDVRVELRLAAKRTGYETATYVIQVDPVKPKTAMKQTKSSKVTAIPDEGWRVTAGTWNPSGATVQFEWYLYDSADEVVDWASGDSSNSSSTLIDSDWLDDTKRVSVKITASKPGYVTTSIMREVRAGQAIHIVSNPWIDGTPKPGYVLSAFGGDTQPQGSTWKCQWYANGKKISKASKCDYTVSTKDAGKELSVNVYAVATGYAPSIVKTLGPVVVAAAPEFTGGDASITGTAAVGRTLTAVAENFEPKPSSYKYQWHRDGVKVSKATKKTYALSSKDLGKQITVTIKAVRSGFPSLTVTSDPTSPISTLEVTNTVAPSLGTSASVGKKLTVSVGTWDRKPSSYAYQWFRAGLPIEGATSKTFTPTNRDLGYEIYATVVAKAKGYVNSEPVATNGVIVLLGTAPVASKAPVVTLNGKKTTTAPYGELLTVTPGTWSKSDLSITYEWQVQDGDSWLRVAFAQGETQVPDIAQFGIGEKLRVMVTAVRAGYHPGVAYSQIVTVIE